MDSSALAFINRLMKPAIVVLCISGAIIFLHAAPADSLLFLLATLGVLFSMLIFLFNLSLFSSRQQIEYAFKLWQDKRKQLDSLKMYSLAPGEKVAADRTPVVMSSSWYFMQPSDFVNASSHTLETAYSLSAILVPPRYSQRRFLLWQGCDIVLTDRRVIFLLSGPLGPSASSIWLVPGEDSQPTLGRCGIIQSHGLERLDIFVPLGLREGEINIYLHPDPWRLQKAIAPSPAN